MAEIIEREYSYEQEGQTCHVYLLRESFKQEWIEPLWELYHESLHLSDAVQEQSCYTRDTFSGALLDPEYSKTLLLVDGEPQGLILATNILEKMSVAYINPEYIQARFPEEVREGRFGYITCLFVSPRLRNFGFVKLMVRATIDAIRELNVVLAFDVSDKRLFIPELLAGLAVEEGFPLETIPLGSQSYFAFKPLEGR